MIPGAGKTLTASVVSIAHERAGLHITSIPGKSKSHRWFTGKPHYRHCLGRVPHDPAPSRPVAPSEPSLSGDHGSRMVDSVLCSLGSPTAGRISARCHRWAMGPDKGLFYVIFCWRRLPWILVLVCFALLVLASRLNHGVNVARYLAPQNQLEMFLWLLTPFPPGSVEEIVFRGYSAAPTDCLVGQTRGRNSSFGACVWRCTRLPGSKRANRIVPHSA